MYRDCLSRRRRRLQMFNGLGLSPVANIEEWEKVFQKLKSVIIEVCLSSVSDCLCAPIT